MSRRHFGTDGVRGVANIGLTPELAFSLGQAAGRLMTQLAVEPRVVFGRDTRKSSPMLEAALGSGFCSSGVETVTLGVVPTPTVSFVARTCHFGLGAIISASHNPAPDNGIKFVGHDGRKLTDELELKVEEIMGEAFEQRPVGGRIGDFNFDREALSLYLDHLEAIVPERLDGLRVAVDAAHGAAFELGPEILRRLGAEVIACGVSPNGVNINDEGGATKPHLMQEFTRNHGAEVGVAFDGDADRAVFSDERGRLLNGDRTMGIWAAHYQERGELHPPVVIGTVMSNGGFARYLESRGIALERAPVGDKYVSQRIDATSAPIGGEQSGHIVFPRRGPTGDGLATMLEFLRVIKVSGKPASDFYDAYEAMPQVLVNLEVRDRATWRTPEVDRAIESAEHELGEEGRVVVRASGTQPVVRVMVEASDFRRRDQATAGLVATLDLTDGLGD